MSTTTIHVWIKTPIDKAGNRHYTCSKCGHTTNNPHLCLDDCLGYPASFENHIGPRVPICSDEKCYDDGCLHQPCLLESDIELTQETSVETMKARLLSWAECIPGDDGEREYRTIVDRLCDQAKRAT